MSAILAFLNSNPTFIKIPHEQSSLSSGLQIFSLKLKNLLKRHVYPNVYRSTVYNSQDMEATKCPSTDEWIRKLWYIYTMEYYSAIKKNTFELVLMSG